MVRDRARSCCPAQQVLQLFLSLICFAFVTFEGKFFEVNNKVYCRDPKCVFMAEQNGSKGSAKRSLIDLITTPLRAVKPRLG